VKSLGKKLVEAWRSDKWKEQGERFGIGVALAFAVMSAIALYRGHMARAEVLPIVSACLLAAALILPRALYPAAWILETAFKTVTKSIMYVLLVVVFYIVFSPAGIVLRLLGKDPLDRNLDPQADSYWLPRKPRDPSRAEKQF
jgi:hypothetical protein